MDVEKDNLNKVLRETIGEHGTIRFSIKANNTPENDLIHENFRVFCERQCDNNYTMGLKLLMDYKADDFKFEMLHKAIEGLTSEVDRLKGLINEPKIEEKEDEAF